MNSMLPYRIGSSQAGLGGTGMRTKREPIRVAAVTGKCMTVLSVMAVLLCFASTGAADLLWDHFGVQLELDFDAAHTDIYQGVTTYPFDPASFAPTKYLDSVDWWMDDWHGSWSTDDIGDIQSSPGYGTEPAGGEPYDVEAMYFDDDAANLYIAIVTSFPPPPGLYESRLGNTLVVTGDLALNLGLNSPYSDGFRYDYGVNVNHEHRPISGNATSGGTTVGNEVYRTANSDWYLGSPHNAIPGSGELTNFDPNWSGFSGSYAGAATVAYRQLNFGGYEETLWPTYVVEITIPRSLLVTLDIGDVIGLSWASGCRNDAGTISHSAWVDVPEPGTLVLLVLGVSGLGIYRRRRSKTQPGEA